MAEFPDGGALRRPEHLVVGLHEPFDGRHEPQWVEALPAEVILRSRGDRRRHHRRLATRLTFQGTAAAAAIGLIR